MATRQKRNVRIPSSSHKLVEFARDFRREGVKVKTALEAHRDYVSDLAGIAGADWAIKQLTTEPFAAPGWPAPPLAKLRRRKRNR